MLDQNVHKFLFFLNKFKKYEPVLIENMTSEYIKIFEGVNDLKFVFKAEDIFDKIINNVSAKRHTFGYKVTIFGKGFQYSHPSLYKGYDLNIRWVNKNDFLPHYDTSVNYIFIPIDIEYDQKLDTIIPIIEKSKDTLIHELRHWHDHVQFDIDRRKFTKRSELEQNSLNKLKNSVNSLKNDDYNQTTELNANISEFIEYILNLVFNYNEIYSFERLLKIFNDTIDISILTKDMKKRLYKRLFVFYASLIKFSVEQNKLPFKDRTTNNLRNMLIKEMIDYTGVIESIDYTHNDIISKKDKIIFEANYQLDSDYRKWFNKKYVKNGKCLVYDLKDLKIELD
jgi:hypothetical protein